MAFLVAADRDSFRYSPASSSLRETLVAIFVKFALKVPIYPAGERILEQSPMEQNQIVAVLLGIPETKRGKETRQQSHIPDES